MVYMLTFGVYSWQMYANVTIYIAYMEPMGHSWWEFFEFRFLVQELRYVWDHQVDPVDLPTIEIWDIILST